jgi:hypothetical protein
MRLAVVIQWSLAAVSAVLSVALGFFLLPSTVALKLVQHAGYYFIFAAAAGFAVVALRELRQQGDIRWDRHDWQLVALALIICLVWQFNEVHGFKVLMDELVLGGTSMTMHFDRDVFVPMKAHELDGEYIIFGGILDKRPLFFPFLVSVLHDMTGYRPSNVFVLNGILSFILLALVGRTGRLLSGSTFGGALALLLLAGAPLLGLSATGGGFDLLNVAMICVLLLACDNFLRRPSANAQNLLLLSTVLLAQTRYESAVFVAATGFVLLLGWWRERKPRFSWGLAAAPLLLLTIPLQNKLFSLRPGYWSSALEDEPFSPKFFLGNLGHAVNFLFSLNDFQPTSLPLAIAGVTCTPFAFIFLLRRWKGTVLAPDQSAFLATGTAMIANTGLLMFYFWGQLDDFVATRLALPLLLLFALSSAFVLGRWFAQRQNLRVGVLVVSMLWLWLVAIPFSAKANATKGFLSFNEVQLQERFISAHPGRILFVISRPLPAILQRRPAMTLGMLNERPVEMEHHLKLRTFDDVFVMQRLQINPATREYEPRDDNALDPEFILETVEETQLQPLYVHRISRLVAVDLDRIPPRPPDWKPAFPPLQVPAPQGESPTGAFVREYLDKLP